MTVGFVAGMDLGQSADYSCLVIIESQEQGFMTPKKHVGALLHLRHIMRWELHTPYPTIAAQTKALLTQPQLRGKTQLVVDGTGVGRPVVDMLSLAGLTPIPVSITGGEKTNLDQGWWSVPKRELVSSLAIAFETGALLIAQGLPLASVLLKELQNFKAKISVSGSESFEAWRERDHDDLVLGTALAVWYAKRGQPNFRYVRL